MHLRDLLSTLWSDYIEITPQAARIHQLLEERGETIVNDHIAIRTLNLPHMNVATFATFLQSAGYVVTGSYRFEEKRLFAKSFSPGENLSSSDADLGGLFYPKIFVSELAIEEFSERLQKIVRTLGNQVPRDKGLESMLTERPSWPRISYRSYQDLREESEYAAWLATMGLRANHFTVSMNHLQTFEDIDALNDFLRQAGFSLNGAGRQVQGSPDDLLEQSSTVADRLKWEFQDGHFEVPTCYYEFAMRYIDRTTGQLFDGFVTKSADKIFESTDVKDQSKTQK